MKSLLNHRRVREIACRAGYTQVPREAITALEEELTLHLRIRFRLAREASRRKRITANEALYVGGGLKPRKSDHE